MLNNKDGQFDNQLENFLKNRGRKLGILISATNFPEEVKESLVSILPKMSLDQIDRLIDIFEARYISDQVTNIDAEFKEKIENIIKQYKKEKEESEISFSKKLDNFSKNLDI